MNRRLKSGFILHAVGNVILGFWLILSTRLIYNFSQDDTALKLGLGKSLVKSVLLFNLPIWLFLIANSIHHSRKHFGKTELKDFITRTTHSKFLISVFIWIVVTLIGTQVLDGVQGQAALLQDSHPRQSVKLTPTPTPTAVKAKADTINEEPQIGKVAPKITAPAKPEPIETTVPGAQGEYLTWTEVGENSGKPLVWKTCEPIKVFLNTGGSPYAEADVRTAIGYINKMGRISFVFAGTNKQMLTTRATLGDYKVQVTYGPRDSFPNAWNTANALAMAGVAHSANEYVAGQVAVYLPAMDAANQQIRSDVILHEFGHLLGLNHTTTKGDIMYPSTSDDVAPVFNPEVLDYFAKNPGCTQ